MIASPQSHHDSSEKASTDLDLGNHSSEAASTDLYLGNNSSEAASTDLYRGDNSSEAASIDLYLGNRNEVGVSTNGDGNAPEETLRTSHQSGSIEKEAFSSIPCFDVEQLPPVEPHSEIDLSGGSPKQYGDSAGAWAGKKTVCLDNSWEGSSRKDFDRDTRHGLPSPASSEEAHMTTTSLGDEKVIMEEDQNLDISTILSKEKERPMKLSPAKIHELTSTLSSLPLALGSAHNAHQPMNDASGKEDVFTDSSEYQLRVTDKQMAFSESSSDSLIVTPFTDVEDNNMNPPLLSATAFNNGSRPQWKGRTASAPPSKESRVSSKPPEKDMYYQASSPPPSQKPSLSLPPPLQTHDIKLKKSPKIEEPTPSPMPQSIPIPPLSLPTYLQLELSSHKPSPLYIHRSETSNFPYESSHVKLERLQNFLLLPPQLEQVLWFGALACLDAWLFSFTILPLRFLKALSILVESWGRNVSNEVRLLSEFIYSGTGRMWRRRRRDSIERSRRGSLTQIDPRLRTTISSESSPTTPRFPSLIEREHPGVIHSQPEADCKHQSANPHQHRRSKSMPSALLPDHKADILKGLLIVISCTILMYFDASRMYHSIRGQAAIKLYVIYNVLEVCDRLFSALGQDVLECLFSKETLERKSDGHSKILRPLWLFILALIYNLVHATSLFYQVITLNVAVNSYSNALLTLLMSNQFVEIKSTVFKKFEKENLFQLTCADVVERFQLWLMLTIIASRNFIETGGLSLGSGESSGPRTGTGSGFTAPLTGPSILPKSFTMFPEWTGQVMGPFLLVLGSEMLVDWIKHAYITKFNNTKPAIYGRFLDVLAKDYYSNAFADQNLTRRLGLPVIPLASLFIRASVQTYHMWLATNMPLPIPSASTSLSVEPETSSPAATAALQHIDHVFRRALGRSTFGAGSSSTPTTKSSEWTSDDMIAFMTMLIFFLVLFLVLLAFKLVLGMCLLSFARRRYRGMKEREKVSTYAEGKRVGGWGVVEVDEDKRRWIYKDDLKGARRMRERAAADGEKIETNQFYEGVSRYSMVAKRIW